MRITLLQVGKTEQKWLQEGFAEYERRLRHYIRFESRVIPSLKLSRSISESQQNKLEAELILKNIPERSLIILLDDKGKQYSSEDFAVSLQNKMNTGVQHLVFIIGGPYGFDQVIYQKANEKLSLSKMTFSHQMVRPIFLEQLYRAFTILRNEPYHH